MMNVVDELETTIRGEFETIYRRCIAELKRDAQELELLGEEIRMVITRTESYFGNPVSTHSRPMARE